MGRKVKPTTPTAAAKSRLWKAINRWSKARVDFSWRGGGDPADVPGIEQEYDAAYQDLALTIESMHICETLAYWNPTEERPKTARERKAYLTALAAL